MRRLWLHARTFDAANSRLRISSTGMRPVRWLWPSPNPSRWDCISINEKPVDEATFRKVENNVIQLNESCHIKASPFEVLTATAFHIFNQEKVQVGVVEVGMGGKLDSTNILNNQAVSVISKIARDHEGFLGNTLEEIATHKAGILRPNVPFIVNPTNEQSVQHVIDRYATEIEAGPRLSGDIELKRLFSSVEGQQLQPFQRDNATLAIVAVMETLKSLKVQSSVIDLAKSLTTETGTNPGRLQYLTVPPVFGDAKGLGREILVDGAHNPDAAEALDSFVCHNERSKQTGPQSPTGSPVTWVLAMTDGKDACQYLRTLLRPGDNVVTTTFGPVDGMPWVKPMDARELLEVAKSVQPQITGTHVPGAGALRALCAAKHFASNDTPIVLTGSLYLVGHLHRELRSRDTSEWWTAESAKSDRTSFLDMQREEELRVNQVLITKDDGLEK
jgi:folylpolyglutamate synthase/dihydrofolate synthase